MATWAEFSSASPDLATAGRSLLYRTQTGEALLATVRGDQPPRIHPIWVAIIDGRLYSFIMRSAKRMDLELDGRYALHTHTDPAAPSEFSIRGRATLVGSTETRSTIGGKWYFDVDGSYELFEFGIESAILGVRSDADEWPPRYSSCRAPDPE